MKLLATAGALACAPLLLLAAPAASAGRWQPDPVDFELAPRGGLAAATAAGRVVSRPLRAPGRFNLVGARWRGRESTEIELRVRDAGGRWSHWQALEAHAGHGPDRANGRSRSASEPVWVGEADQVQYRLSRPLPGLRLHFVNVRGSATPAERAHTARRRPPRATPASFAAPFGAAADATPRIVRRAAWGARKCPPRGAPSYGDVQAVHVHHTVSLNDYAPAEAPDIVLAICRYHRYSNGWDDIGYHALVDKYGVLYEGRAGGLDQAVLGAHAQGFNAQSAGVASIGDNSSLPLSEQALDAAARYISWKLQVHGRPRSGRVTLVSAGGATSRYPAGRRVAVNRVSGHRDTNATACPGEALYAQLDDLRARVATGKSLPGLPTAFTLALSQARVAFGGSASVAGTLVTAGSVPLAGQSVVVEVMRGARWATLAQLQTDAAGNWSIPVKPRRTRLLRARFAGTAELRASSSPVLRLGVRPRVTLDSVPGASVRGRRVLVSGRVTPSKRVVYQILEQRIGRGYKRVGTRVVPVKRGRFRSSFVPGYSGLYRVYVSAPADPRSDGGRSARQTLRVARR